MDILIWEMVIAGPRCDRWLRPWTLSDNWQQVERKKVPQGPTRGEKVPQGPTRREKVPQGPTRGEKVPQGPTRGEKVPQGSAIRKIGSTSIQKARTLRAHPFNM